MKDDFLLNLVKLEGRQAWEGRKPPFNMEIVDLTNSSNYRVSASLHRKFKIVWLYENLLDELRYTGWKTLLDEAIRLLGEEGFIVIRLRDNLIPSVPMIKAFLGRKIGIDCWIEYENQDQCSGLWTLVAKIRRRNLELYQEKAWTFAVLTGGTKVDNVVCFLQSIRDKDVNDNHEILVVGPQSDKYNKYNVKYIDVKQFRDEQYAEISKKKNVIIHAATKPNLMIVHDRYILGENFFEGFEEYGYDFDFLTVKQFDKNGNEFPAYCATIDKLRLAGQIKVENYNNLYETQYLNGGLIIFKTHTAKDIKFNDLLMWNQMEDVEIAKVAMEKGVIPRINFISTATTLDVKEGYLASWINESQYANRLNSPFIGISTKSHKAVLKRISKYVPRWIKQLELYQRLKMKIILQKR